MITAIYAWVSTDDKGQDPLNQVMSMPEHQLSFVDYASEMKRDALETVNTVRWTFRPIHLQSRSERTGDRKLHCVAIYLATGRRATRQERKHL